MSAIGDWYAAMVPHLAEALKPGFEKLTQGIPASDVVGIGAIVDRQSYALVQVANTKANLVRNAVYLVQRGYDKDLAYLDGKWNLHGWDLTSEDWGCRRNAWPTRSGSTGSSPSRPTSASSTGTREATLGPTICCGSSARPRPWPPSTPPASSAGGRERSTPSPSRTTTPRRGRRSAGPA